MTTAMATVAVIMPISMTQAMIHLPSVLSMISGCDEKEGALAVVGHAGKDDEDHGGVMTSCDAG